jgi:peroxiredoxin
VSEGQAFIERYGWTWPSLRDPQRALARRLGATYQPHVILIDASGGIVDTWEGRGDAGVWGAMAAKLP